jgi:hypothetical protein
MSDLAEGGNSNPAAFEKLTIRYQKILMCTVFSVEIISLFTYPSIKITQKLIYDNFIGETTKITLLC